MPQVVSLSKISLFEFRPTQVALAAANASLPAPQRVRDGRVVRAGSPLPVVSIVHFGRVGTCWTRERGVLFRR